MNFSDSYLGRLRKPAGRSSSSRGQRVLVRRRATLEAEVLGEVGCQNCPVLLVALGALGRRQDEHPLMRNPKPELPWIMLDSLILVPVGE